MAKIAAGLLILLALCAGMAHAETMPQGGNGTANAVSITAGSYSGGALVSGTDQYYVIRGIRGGQELSVTGVFQPSSQTYSTLVRINVLDSMGAQLINDEQIAPNRVAVAWLPDSENSTYDYYIEISNTGIWDIGSQTLEIAVRNSYDANSSTDAGDVFEKALLIGSGNYGGYLSGASGTDTRDMYKVANYTAGTPLYVNVTPPIGASMTITFYDANRQILKQESAANTGAIVVDAVNVTQNGDVYVEIACDEWCSNAPVSYSFSVLKKVPEAGGAPAVGGIMLPFEWNQTTTLICCGIAIVLLLLVLIIIFFFRRKREFEAYGEYGMGDAGAPTTIIGYKHPCRYCDKLVDQGAKVCPFCGKVSPLGPLRCPKCRSPVTREQKVCSACGLALRIMCPFCGKATFFGDYCDKCDKRLLVICPNCLKEQPPIGEKCMKCGKNMGKPTTQKVIK